MAKSLVLDANGEKAQKKAPKIVGVHPFGSKILVEILSAKETLETDLYIQEDAKVEGCPQAYIVELGSQIGPEVGLKVGQRVYWEGKGVAIEDPRSNRVRALLEIHNIKAIIEEQS